MTHLESAKPRLTSATLSWFDDGCCDVIYLDIWGETAVSFTPPAQLDASWQTRQRQVTLAQDASEELFRRAADALMRFRFYPQRLVSHFGDFDMGDGRYLRQGDRVVLRFHVWRWWGRPLLDVLGLMEISRVAQEPRRVEIEYVSASPHAVEGRWSVELCWLANGELQLTMGSVSRPSPQEPAHNHRRIFRWQDKLLQAGERHFQQTITQEIIK
ncbi:MAG: DUF1990 family protein [Anaerolineae bacterium]